MRFGFSSPAMSICCHNIVSFWFCHGKLTRMVEVVNGKLRCMCQIDATQSKNINNNVHANSSYSGHSESIRTVDIDNIRALFRGSMCDSSLSIINKMRVDILTQPRDRRGVCLPSPSAARLSPRSRCAMWSRLSFYSWWWWGWFFCKWALGSCCVVFFVVCYKLIKKWPHFLIKSTIYN